MSATTTTAGQVGTDQTGSSSPTHNKRNAVIALTVIALFALSFFAGRMTATNHTSSGQVGTHAQLSPADRAQVANDVAQLTPTFVEVAPNGEQPSPADRALIAGDVAPVSGTGLSPANRSQILNDLAPITPTYVEVAPNGEQPSPALIAGDGATSTGTSSTQLSPANRSEISKDVPVTQQFSQATTASCVVGRPC